MSWGTLLVPPVSPSSYSVRLGLLSILSSLDLLLTLLLLLDLSLLLLGVLDLLLLGVLDLVLLLPLLVLDRDRDVDEDESRAILRFKYLGTKK